MFAMAPVSWTTSFVLIIAGFISYGVFLALYRLYLHPLCKFPGPKVAACTYWYEFYHDLIAGPFPGQGSFNIERLHRRYGPIVRVSPDELSVKDADWFDVLYKTGRRDKWAKNSNANGSPGSVASAVGNQLHRARKAPLTPFFSKRAVNQLEHTIKVKVDQLTEEIEKQYLGPGKVLPVGAAFTALTLDVISDYCFGQSWRCLTQQDFAPQWRRSMTNFDLVPVVKQFPWIVPVLEALPRSVLARMSPDFALFLAAKDGVQKQVERIINEFEERERGAAPGVTNEKLAAQRPQEESEDKPPRTIFQAVLESSLPPEEKKVARITDEAFVMVVAGGETTAKVLTTAVFHLLDNPQWMRRVVAEIDQAMPRPSDLPSHADLEQLPVLAAAVKESLRISSAVTNRLQIVDPEHDLTYKQWSIPTGTPVSMSLLGIHLDPEIFKNPHTFNPARFLGEEGKMASKYYMPFHRGYRSCLGMNLAYTEIFMGLAAMFRRFDLELFETVRERDVDVVRDCFVGLPGPGSKGVRVKIIGTRK